MLTVPRRSMNSLAVDVGTLLHAVSHHGRAGSDLAERRLKSLTERGHYVAATTRRGIAKATNEKFATDFFEVNRSEWEPRVEEAAAMGR